VRNFLVAVTLAFAAIAAPSAWAQSAEEQRQLDWVFKRGQLLFVLDRAAWVATDDFAERVGDLGALGSLGYIVDRNAQGFTTLFFSRDGDKFVAIYRARIGANGVVDPEVFARGSRPELTPVQARMARAVLGVRETKLSGCSGSNPNISIVPPDNPQAPLDVYITASQMRDGHFEFGAHHRLSFDAQGREISRRAFTKSCLSAPVPSQDERKAGAMLGVSHLLDPLPTEVHVFIAMAAEQQIGVITENPRRLWGVSVEGIRLLQDNPPAFPDE